VKHGNPASLNAITNRISKYVTSGAPLSRGRVEVPYDAVDDIISREQQQVLSYGVYLINTPVLSGGQPYVYTSKASNSQQELPRPECGTSLWVGEERYLWVDLSAGPTGYGPISEGEGLVTSSAIPRVDNFKTATAFNMKDFVADLASFVSRACEHVFLPPVKWLSVKDDKITFTVVYVNKNNGKGALPIDWKALQGIVGFLLSLFPFLTLPDSFSSSLSLSLSLS